MPLILTMTQTKGPQRGAGGDRQIRTLAQGTLSIGRAAGNDWVLADPDQHLSRTHCMVAFEGGRYVLTDLSTNGLLINGAREPTTRNSRVVLTDGDTVQLGTWQLAVAESDDPGMGQGGFASSNFVGPRGESRGGGPLDVDPLDDPLGNFESSAEAGFQHHLSHLPPATRAEDPFDRAEEERRHTAGPDEDLFRGADSAEAWKGPVHHERGAVGSDSFVPPRTVAPVNVNDIDFDDLLGDFMPTAAPHPLSPAAANPPAVPPPSLGAASLGSAPLGGHPAVPSAAPLPAGFDDALDDLLGDFAPVSNIAGAPPAPLPATPPPAATPPAAAPAVAGPIAASPAVEPPQAAPPVVAQPMAPAVVEPVTPPPFAAPVGATQAEPTAISPFDAVPRPPAATPAVKQSAGAAADQAALLAAFAEGAGLPQLDLLAGQGAQADPLATMRTIGALFAAFVGGTREVLMSRAEIKHEMRVEQTMMRARDNNALKFSISAQEALVALLHPNRPGYKPPLAAIEEAFTDIRSHEMAVMAGLQTALLALLKRFDPEALESRLQRGMLDAVLPGARKARFWELFCATYKDIATEAQDDFQSVFGREFARAYDAQVRKL